MSIKREYETRIITQQVCVKEVMCCDICKKEINTNKGYWELTTGHHDWGNDSADSIEHFDICSETCLRKKFDEYVKESGEDEWNTMYFEVERA